MILRYWLDRSRVTRRHWKRGGGLRKFCALSFTSAYSSSAAFPSTAHWHSQHLPRNDLFSNDDSAYMATLALFLYAFCNERVGKLRTRALFQAWWQQAPVPRHVFLTWYCNMLNSFIYHATALGYGHYHHLFIQEHATTKDFYYHSPIHHGK